MIESTWSSTFNDVLYNWKRNGKTVTVSTVIFGRVSRGLTELLQFELAEGPDHDAVLVATLTRALENVPILKIRKPLDFVGDNLMHYCVVCAILFLSVMQDEGEYYHLRHLYSNNFSNMHSPLPL